MKIPFSYRQSFFKGVLIASILGHGIFFLQAGLFAPAPEYGVEVAPSSMEVVMIQEEIKEEKTEKEDLVFTAKEKTSEVLETLKQEEEKEPKKEVLKPVVTPPIQGALTEAKPAHLKNPPPLYPRAARENGWQGIVLLKVLVQKDGTVGEILIEKSSGHSMLDTAAINAIKKWQFLPSKLGNIPFESWVQIPIRFVLDRA